MNPAITNTYRPRPAAVSRRRPAACGNRSPESHQQERSPRNGVSSSTNDDHDGGAVPPRLRRVERNPLSKKETLAIGLPESNGLRRRDGWMRIVAAILTLRRCHAIGVLMLVFTRKVGESFVIDSPDGLITVKVISFNHAVRIGIDAPQQVRVDRQEVHEIPPALRRDGRRQAG